MTIDKVDTFCSLLSRGLPPRNDSFVDLLGRLDDIARNRYGAVTTSALANCHGSWYEWFLAIAAWNRYCRNQDFLLPILMPNVEQFDVAQLYNVELYTFIEDLRAKVQAATGVSMITSNPDFVLIDTHGIENQTVNLKRITTIDRDEINSLQRIYSEFEGKCDLDNVAGFISVKTSLRPDRRLQIPHEGSLMKAVYTHLQTRKWVINPRGLRYYAVATRLTDADKHALKTVATHSIVTVHSKPEAAVDAVFEVDTLGSWYRALTQIQRVHGSRHPQRSN